MGAGFARHGGRHILTEPEQLAGGARGVKPGLARARAGFSLFGCWELSCEGCGAQVRLGGPSGILTPCSDDSPLFPQRPGHLPHAGGPGRGSAAPEQALRWLGRVPSSLWLVRCGAQGKAELPPGDSPS